MAGATIDTCGIANCTLTNCDVTDSDFEGTNTLINCTTRGFSVRGQLIVQGGTVEDGVIKKKKGCLVNQGAQIRDVDGYQGS